MIVNRYPSAIKRPVAEVGVYRLPCRKIPWQVTPFAPKDSADKKLRLTLPRSPLLVDDHQVKLGELAVQLTRIELELGY